MRETARLICMKWRTDVLGIVRYSWVGLEGLCLSFCFMMISSLRYLMSLMDLRSLRLRFGVFVGLNIAARLSLTL